MGRLKQTGLGDKSGLTRTTSQTTEPPKQKATRQKKTKTEELVTVNIKIPKTSKQWLAEQSQQVRDNNSEPVPPKERVYPQHLINLGIKMLQNADINWSKVQNIEEIEEQLNL